MPPEGPLALVLSGGGARAAYQVGVLSGIAERSGCDLCFPIVTGVSAGAINAVSLASGQGSFRQVVGAMERTWLGLSIEQVFHSGVLSLAASALRWVWGIGTGGLTPGLELRGVLDTRPLRSMLEGLLLPEGVEVNLASHRIKALAVSATCYTTGGTVTFVQERGEQPSWRRAGRRSERGPVGPEHVLASCALPLLFPAVEIGGAWYGDGSIRQTAPLAPAIHLGARRILAVSLRHGAQPVAEGVGAAGPPPAQVLGMLFNAVFLHALEADAERLERVNRSLRMLEAQQPHPEGLRTVGLEVLRPSRDLGELSRDLRHCLPGSLRLVLRGLGSGRLHSPDFLSYLLFERPYVERLLELGRADARAQWDRLEPLLAGELAAGASRGAAHRA